MNPIAMLVYDRTIEQHRLSVAALESALAQDIPVDVHVFDNGSTCPETVDWLASEKRISLTRIASNVSPIKLANAFMENLFERYDYILGIPNDVLLPPDLYRRMLEWPQGIVAASMDGENPPAIGQEVVRLHGDVHMAVPLVRKFAWQMLVKQDGFFFDPHYFNYASDCDLKVRLFDAGIPTAQLSIQCWHYGGASHRLAPDASSVHRQADVDRAYFERKWGFKIGSPEYDKRIPSKNCAPTPTCMCGEKMTHREWTELAIEGGTRTVYGVSCSTDGCPGNFPQVWESIMKNKLLSQQGEYEYSKETEWKGAQHLIQESYIKPSPEYPMGSWMQKIDDEVVVATGAFEKEFPGHPSHYLHGAAPFVVFNIGDWEWNKENNGKT